MRAMLELVDPTDPGPPPGDGSGLDVPRDQLTPRIGFALRELEQAAAQGAFRIRRVHAHEPGWVQLELRRIDPGRFGSVEELATRHRIEASAGPPPSSLWDAGPTLWRNSAWITAILTGIFALLTLVVSLLPEEELRPVTRVLGVLFGLAGLAVVCVAVPAAMRAGRGPAPRAPQRAIPALLAYVLLGLLITADSLVAGEFTTGNDPPDQLLVLAMLAPAMVHGAPYLSPYFREAVRRGDLALP